MSQPRSRVSIVVPVYNEEANLRELHRRLTLALSPVEASYEILLVDDGSHDASFQTMVEIRAGDARVRCVRLLRNFGHQVAVAAGLDFSDGQCVVTMDADLQHPPELIPELLRHWAEGYEVVSTRRDDGPEIGRFKRWTSRLFYRAMSALSDVTLDPGSADFRLLDARVVDALRSLRERGHFLRGLVTWLGFREISVPYRAGPRFAGASKYSMRSMVRLAADGITSFSSVPLHLSTYLGFAVSLLSFAYAGYAVYAHVFTNRTVEGWTSVMVAVLFLAGVQLISLGIIGAYLARVFQELKGRPLYLVRDTVGLDS
jgi:glycosyltransferase involved in cell wall biosynthesis